MIGGFIVPSALPAKRMESQPLGGEKRQNRKTHFAGFQGVNPPNPAIRDYFNAPSSPGKSPGSAFFTDD